MSEEETANLRFTVDLRAPDRESAATVAKLVNEFAHGLRDYGIEPVEAWINVLDENGEPKA